MWWERVIVRDGDDVVDEYRQLIVLDEDHSLGPWRVEVRLNQEDKEPVYEVTAHWPSGGASPWKVGSFFAKLSAWGEAMKLAEEYVADHVSEFLSDLLKATGNPLTSALDLLLKEARTVPDSTLMRVEYDIPNNHLRFNIESKEGKEGE